MTNDYTNKLLDEFDQMFLELVGDFDAQILDFPAAKAEAETDTPKFTQKPRPEEQLQKINDVTNRISAERFNPGANIDVLLADLIDSILQILNGSTAEDDFFRLLNEERTVKLDDALTEFDFYHDNPYKNKAEKYLAKLEAKKNKR
jgi:hypothetical protein